MPKRLIHEAQDRASEGNYERALALLDEVLTIAPENVQAHHERGMVLGNLNRRREAIASFQAALDLDPMSPGSRAWLARNLSKLGEHRRAGEEWLRLLRDRPDGPPGMGVSPMDWTNCAEQFALAGDPQRAITLLEEYLAEHSARVTRYTSHLPAPLNLLARLVEPTDPKRAEDLRPRASQR